MAFVYTRHMITQHRARRSERTKPNPTLHDCHRSYATSHRSLRNVLSLSPSSPPFPPPIPRHPPTAYYRNVTGISTFGDKGALDHRRLQSSTPPSSFSPLSPLSLPYHEQTNAPAARNLAASAAAAGSESGAAASSGHDCSAFDPHHCEIELLHLLEDLHMILFLVVIIYFAYSLWLLRRSVQ